MYNPFNCESHELVGYRKPTAYEIKFGYGATHYRTFNRGQWLKPNGTLKRWIKATDDGLRYYRPR